MSDRNTDSSSADSLDESARHYDEFFGPMYFEPYAVEITKRIDAGTVSVVLELAAGTGRVTRHIREMIPPQAKLVASDIDREMLAVAKHKLAQLSIDWQFTDASNIPFEDNSVDVVVCSFGYMFVPDKVKAFAEAYRVLRPGGQLLFTTWDKLENNGASYLARGLAARYLKQPVSGSADQATSMSDEGEIQHLLEEAGFTRFTVEKVQLEAVCRTANEAAEGLVSGAVYKEIRKRDPAAIEAIKVKLEIALADKYGAAPMVAPMSALVVEAWK